MNIQNVTAPLPQGLESMGKSEKDSGHDRAGDTSRTTGVSLFRRGTVAANPTVTYDLATGREIFAHGLPSLALNPVKVWESLATVRLSPEYLLGNGLFPMTSDNPAAAAFDHLRSRLLHGLTQKGWRKIAISSPTHGCGKSFVATNLALTLARRPDSRTVLLDLDLRRPRLASILGISDAPPLADYLSGEQPLEAIFRRFGRTLALGVNGAPVPMAAEMLHSPEAAEALAAISELLDPEVVLIDLPPVLAGDDVLAVAGQVDAVLLVTDGRRTRPEEIRACERVLEGRLPLLGVVLNRAEEPAAQQYGYGRN